jgi:hypothetical protein
MNVRLKNQLLIGTFVLSWLCPACQFTATPAGSQLPYSYTPSSNRWSKGLCFAAYGLADTTVGAGGVACATADFRGAYIFKQTSGYWQQWASPTWFAISNGRMAGRFPQSFYPNATRPVRARRRGRRGFGVVAQV